MPASPTVRLGRPAREGTDGRPEPRQWLPLSPPALALTALVALYIATFGTLTWRQQSNFATFGFDMGIYDQGIWLLSEFREPFVTVRGLHFFGHHVNLIAFAFVPFYWLGAGPHFLYLVETVWMAAGAIPLFLLARDRLENAWMAVAAAAAFLLYPSLQWVNWWHFHPDALIITPLLFAWWLASRRRWGWFAVAVAVALACKEDAALAVAALGFVLLVKGRRRAGVFTAITGVAWFALATRVVIPAANDGLHPLYAELYPGLGDSVFEIAWNMLLHPSVVWDLATEGGPAGPRTYYWQLLAPVAFLPFAAPLVLLVAAPQVLANVASAHSYTHDIRFHYSAIVTAAVFLATVEGLARVKAVPHRRLAVFALVAAATVGNVAWSPSPLSQKFDTGIWAGRASPRHGAVNRALDLVPGDAGVSATYYLVPHLTQRVHVYEWPNPFVAANWGVQGSPPPDPEAADWLVLDRTLVGDSAPTLAALLGPSGPFDVVFDEDDVLVARRRAGP